MGQLELPETQCNGNTTKAQVNTNNTQHKHQQHTRKVHTMAMVREKTRGARRNTTEPYKCMRRRLTNRIPLLIVMEGLKNKRSEEEIIVELNRLVAGNGNKLTELKSVFLWENEDGVDVFTFSALTNLSKVVEFLLKIFFTKLFNNNPEDALTYLRKRDKGGNTIISAMAYQGDSVLKAMGILLSTYYAGKPVFNPCTFNKHGLQPIHYCFLNKERAEFPTKLLTFFSSTEFWRKMVTVKDVDGNNIMHYFFNYYRNNHSSLDNPSAYLDENLQFLLNLDKTIQLLLLIPNNKKEAPIDVFKKMHSREIAKHEAEPDEKKKNEDCNEVITIDDNDNITNDQNDESKLIIEDDDITNDKSDESNLIIDDDYYIEENLLVIDEDKQNDDVNSLDEQDLIRNQDEECVFPKNSGDIVTISDIGSSCINKDNQGDFRKDANEEYEVQNSCGETGSSISEPDSGHNRPISLVPISKLMKMETKIKPREMLIVVDDCQYRYTACL